MIDGRLPRLHRSDEILVTHAWAGTFGVGVGDELDLVLTSGQGGPSQARQPPDDGPVDHMSVVGVKLAPGADVDGITAVLSLPSSRDKPRTVTTRSCWASRHWTSWGGPWVTPSRSTPAAALAR